MDDKEPIRIAILAGGTQYTCPCGAVITATASNREAMEEWIGEHEQHTNGMAEFA